MKRRSLLLGLTATSFGLPGCAQEPDGISLISLIATPKLYNGKKVRVIGFLNLEFEGNHLYVSKADYDAAISKNSVWVDIHEPAAPLKPAGLSGRYVLIEGTFDSERDGHMGLSTGTLGRITRMEAWPSREEFRRMAREASKAQ